MITPSPSTVGSTATRTSSPRPAVFALTEMRPSCGLRCSATSSFASTLMRVTTPGACRSGIRSISCITPSRRTRTTMPSLRGRKWMSLAPSSAAWRMIELTSRIGGASEMPSSASRSELCPPSSSRTSLVVVDQRGPLAELGAAASRCSSNSISSRAATAIWIGCRDARRSSSTAPGRRRGRRARREAARPRAGTERRSPA